MERYHGIYTYIMLRISVRHWHSQPPQREIKLIFKLNFNNVTLILDARSC
jgi:hypothetical protein